MCSEVCAVVCMLHVWTRVRRCSLLFGVVWEVYEVQDRAVWEEVVVRCLPLPALE